MPLPDFRVLSFACYGTLIDADAGVYAALRPLLASAGVSGDRPAVLAAFRRHESTARAADPTRPYADVLADAHRALAHEWSVICSQHDHALFARSVPQWPPFPDAFGALQYLRRYFRIAIVTNSDRASVEASSRRLECRFDAVVTPEDAGACKPDRRHYEQLFARLERLGATPGQALHVGHSVQHDLEAAAAAGLPVAWIDRERVAQLAISSPERTGGASREPRASDADARWDYVYPSLAALVRAHQDQLRA